MTGFRRVATCKCCGVDPCGANSPYGCTTGTSNCPSTYAVALTFNTHTFKINCGTIPSPSCQDYSITPSLSTSVTVTQNGTNKCRYEGTTDLSSVTDTWTTNPCSGSGITYEWDEVIVNLTTGISPSLDDAQLAPCGNTSYCSKCAGVCAEIFLKANYTTGRGSATIAFNFSACYFSHCIDSCSDLVPCFNSYGSIDQRRTRLTECDSPNICTPCLTGTNGWGKDCTDLEVTRSQTDWGFTASIS